MGFVKQGKEKEAEELCKPEMCTPCAGASEGRRRGKEERSFLRLIIKSILLEKLRARYHFLNFLMFPLL